MRRLPTRQKMLASVDDWNRQHAVGTPVTVKLDSGARVGGETTSAAYMLGGHTPVIHISTVRGCYALARVIATKGAAR